MICTCPVIELNSRSTMYVISYRKESFLTSISGQCWKNNRLASSSKQSETKSLTRTPRVQQAKQKTNFPSGLGTRPNVSRRRWYRVAGSADSCHSDKHRGNCFAARCAATQTDGPYPHCHNRPPNLGLPLSRLSVGRLPHAASIIGVLLLNFTELFKTWDGCRVLDSSRNSSRRWRDIATKTLASRETLRSRVVTSALKWRMTRKNADLLPVDALTSVLFWGEAPKTEEDNKRNGSRLFRCDVKIYRVRHYIIDQETMKSES